MLYGKLVFLLWGPALNQVFQTALFKAKALHRWSSSTEWKPLAAASAAWPLPMRHRIFKLPKTGSSNMAVNQHGSKTAATLS
jgi:hypothetical protein